MYNHTSENYPIKNGYNIIAICIKTNKKFYDYKNKSGTITNHIKKTYNIDLPSKYKRKKIERTTGKFWYHDYFEFKYEKKSEIKKCDYCNWTTTDINNHSGAYEKHLKNAHNININEHLLNNPKDKSYFKKEIYNELVTCKICNKKMKYITNTHLMKHGITQIEYKLKYDDVIISPNTKKKLISNYEKYLKSTNKIKTSTLEEFIISHIPITFSQSNRDILNGKEIDLLYNNIGFEINRSIYHTENFGKKSRRYHLNKTILASNKNVDLYHIFEDEIIDAPDIIINKIKHILNINESNKIHARKCQLHVNLNAKEKSYFLNENHIQGNDNSNINIYATYDNKVIALMTFNNKRHMNKTKNHNHSTYELSRFCIKNDLIITGIGSRLLKHFINLYSPSKIISFADRRWTPNSTNNIYTKLNFDLIKTLPPDYYYYNPKISRYKRFHKFGFGKKNIKKRFPEIYDENKSEWEMMCELGYDRIWDCGKYKYELNLEY